MLNFTETFCFVHDFCKAFELWWERSLLNCKRQNRNSKRRRKCNLHLSEIITILIGYHNSGFKCFKSYYQYLMLYHRKEFPGLVSYDRFTALIKRGLPAITRILHKSSKSIVERKFNQKRQLTEQF